MRRFQKPAALEFFNEVCSSRLQGAGTNHPVCSALLLRKRSILSHRIKIVYETLSPHSCRDNLFQIKSAMVGLVEVT